MSQGKFAPITAGLLARKGEAAPWVERTPLAWRAAPPPLVLAHAQAPEPRAAEPPPPGPVKRCTVRLSAHDYERLGIMAVKKDVSRQHLLQAALARVLEEMARELPDACSCLEGCGQACTRCPL